MKNNNFYHKTFYEYLFSQELLANIIEGALDIDKVSLYSLALYDTEDLIHIQLFLNESYQLQKHLEQVVFKQNIQKLIKILLTNNFPSLHFFIHNKDFLFDEIKAVYSQVFNGSH